jgi:monovalent cation/hydrogen antiporter
VHLAAADVVAVVAIAAAVAGLANRFDLSAPLALTALGLVLSFVPGVPTLPLEPEVVLVGILPPLLYATAIRTPWVDITRNRRPIALLSVGLVIVTAFAVAVAVRLILPGTPWAVAIALGAVVAPPDAVAASAVARRVRMPRKVVSLLEGESLLNDATALVTLGTAITAAKAAAGESVSVGSVGVDFLLAVVAGCATGWVVALLVSFVRRHVEDPVLDTSLSLIVPYAAYLIAEDLGGSGVLAVVIAGLILGHRSTEIQSAASRVTERTIWRTVQFLLESVVFLLIGLQVKDYITDAMADDSTGNVDVLRLSAVVLLTVVLVRAVWVFPATYLPRLIPRIRRTEAYPAPRNVALVAWAGMRGVVTLAAVLTIPADLPGQKALVVAAFAVVVGTLLLQGTTLPWLVKALRVEGPDDAQDALQEALIQQRAAHAGLDRLAEAKIGSDAPDVVGSLQAWGERVANAAWERLGSTTAERETPAATFQRLRVTMLEAERRVVAGILRDGSVPHDLVERVLERVDQEEAMLGGFSTAAGRPVGGSEDDDEVGVAVGSSGSVGSAAVRAACEHLAAAPFIAEPTSALDACPDCLAIGDRNWVHLRMCLTCGHVGCCDSSPNRHANAHYDASDHPVMRSIELGESWRWCFIDGELG